ncbi:MAG: DNA/RNA non-specific endonuclease [Nitrosomonas sp.]|nr:DNA/RNA non-specific endonuclease [Nitrosomonas sp.]
MQNVDPNPGTGFPTPVKKPAAAAIGYIAHAAKNTSGGVNTTSLHEQTGGTPVGANRPTDWVKFVAMIGKHNNKYVQGHSLSQKLGGLGQANNLSPFTRSLNGLHSSKVEQPIINFQKGVDQYVDYSVTVNYGGNAALTLASQGYFAGQTKNAKLVAMNIIGVIDDKEAAGYKKSKGPIPAGSLYLQNYITAAFPSTIDCDVYFIKNVGKGVYKKNGQANNYHYK